MKTIYVEKNLDEILGFFAQGFKTPEGEKIVKAEWIVDPVIKAVVFKLTIATKPDPNDISILVDPPKFLSPSP